MKKAKMFLISIISSLTTVAKTVFQNPTFRRVLLYIGGIVGGGVISIYALSIIFDALGKFIEKHFDTIFMTAALVAGVLAVISIIKQKQLEQEEIWRRWKEEQERLAKENAMFMQESFLSDSFLTIQKILYNILAAAPNIGLVLPPLVSDLTSPNRWDIRQGIAVFQFLIAKAVDTIDPISIQNIIQTTITNRARAGELPGVSYGAYFYKGIAYPPIHVDYVNGDNLNYAEIGIVIMSDAYAEHLRMSGMGAFGINDVIPNDRSFS